MKWCVDVLVQRRMLHGDTEFGGLWSVMQPVQSEIIEVSSLCDSPTSGSGVWMDSDKEGSARRSSKPSPLSMRRGSMLKKQQADPDGPRSQDLSKCASIAKVCLASVFWWPQWD